MKRFFLALACILMFASCTESGGNNKKSNDNQQVGTSKEEVVADTLDVTGYINRARLYLANQQVFPQ